MSETETVNRYFPNQRHDLGIFRTWIVMSANIIRSRQLIWVLFKRDFFGQYKKSFLGIGWVVISPILGIASWVLMQQAGVLNPGELSVPYPVYVLLGTTVWGLFMGFKVAAAGTLSTGKGLLTQVSYPHEVLLIKQVASQLANFLISFALIMAVLVAFNVAPAWQTVFFPLVAFPMFLMGSAIGLMLSMISVVAIDITKFTNMAMTFLMYLSPIVYSEDVDSRTLKTVMAYNPLTHLVCSARDIVLYGRLYDVAGYFYSAGFALVCFLIAWRLFYVSEGRLIERMV